MDKEVKISALDMPDVPMGKLPEHVELQRTRVVCKLDAPMHTEGVHYLGAYAAMGVDNSLCLDSFCDGFKVVVNQLTEDEMEFEMIGIDAPLANAFRRILTAEVPTMSIDQVYVANNTSLVSDESLASRLGLVPLKVDPRLFEYRADDAAANERNTIVYKLNVSCPKGGPRLTVKSDQLKWLPHGSEMLMTVDNPAPNSSGEPPAKPKILTSFSCHQDTLPEIAKNPPVVKHGDIILAKLGPGQEIELEAHATKGISKTHAKWSPVATAWYRMFPEVVFLKEVKDEDAEKLVAKCPVKVFDIEDIGNGEKKVVAANPRVCTLCRECLRGGGDEFVELRRVKDHFIFTIESTGGLPPEVLFTEAVKILEEKCDRGISELS